MVRRSVLASVHSLPESGEGEGIGPEKRAARRGWTRPALTIIPYAFYYQRKEGSRAILVKITSKHQITLPSHVLDRMDVGAGDQLQLIPGPDGYLLRPRRIDYSRLGTLREKIPRGHPPFDIRAFRDNPHDPALRD